MLWQHFPNPDMTLYQNAATRMAQSYNVMPLVPVLESGGLILYPTDTIWGIGCDATDAAAVDKVFELKQRPKNKPFVLLAADTEMLKNYVEHLHPRLETLLQYHKRPLTLIYDRAKNLPPNCIGADGTVAIRIPQDEFCRDLIAAFGKPLVASSANISNEPFPAFFGEISSQVISGVDAVADHRRWDKSPHEPSVIARLDERDELVFLR